MFLNLYNYEIFNIVNIILFIIIIIYKIVSIDYYVKVIDVKSISATTKEYIEKAYIVFDFIIISKYNNIKNTIIYKK